MYRIKESYKNAIEIERSEFITYLFRVFSEEEAREYLQIIQKQHPTANHHCYAFILGEHQEIQRSSDNREPSGTAGVPMLESLKKNHMQDILAITVRYFGGIKLGAGGLIRAYSKSVSQALQGACITRSIQTNIYTINFSYDLIGKLDYFFSQNNIQILDKAYDVEVCYTYQSIEDISTQLAELTSAKYLPVFIEERNIEEIITPQIDNT